MSPLPKPVLEGGRLLVVDDQVELLENLVEILEIEGAEVRTATTGEQALEQAAEGFDVALLDVRLPDASGVELLPRLKKAAPEAEVLLVTGQGSLDHAMAALNHGAYAYVLKPFEPEALVSNVERALRQVRSTRQAAALTQALQVERDFISAIFDTLGALVVVLDTEGHPVRFNRACEQLTGQSHEQLEQMTVWEGLVPEEEREEVHRVFERLLETRQPSQHENHWLTAGGERRLIAWSNSVIVRDGVAAFVVGSGIDVTEQRRAEAERKRAHDELAEANLRLRQEQAKLVQAEKLSSIGQLASGVAHEVNNPLAGVQACVRSLRAGRVNDDRRDAYYDAVEDGLARIERITRALVDFARPRVEKMEDVDVRDVVESCLRLTAPTQRKKRVTVDLDPSVKTAHVHGDRFQLMQAAMNVLINAIHASPAGGTITVSAEHADDRVGLHFLDQGPGIPEEHISRVCDPFFTTKPEGEGTGLGLSVTQSIIDRHDGLLAIENPEGGGARVTFWLPAAEG